MSKYASEAERRAVGMMVTGLFSSGMLFIGGTSLWGQITLPALGGVFSMMGYYSMFLTAVGLFMALVFLSLVFSR